MPADEITAEASPPGVAAVAAAFDGFARRNRLPESLTQATQVALDEILSNIVKAGFEPGVTGNMNVLFAIAGPSVEIVVSYNGAPFDPLSRPDPLTRGRLEDRAVGGLGIYLVKKLMDAVVYERVGETNRLRLTKRVGT